jgi:hypothetical protein
MPVASGCRRLSVEQPVSSWDIYDVFSRWLIGFPMLDCDHLHQTNHSEMLYHCIIDIDRYDRYGA